LGDDRSVISHSALVVRGTSGYLAVPIIAIPAIAIGAFTYFRSHLPEFCIQNAEKILLTSALLTLALVGVAWFRRTRRIEYLSGQLRYRSWITDKAVAAAQISAATFETEISGSGDQTTTEHYLSLWSGNEAILRFNSQLWPRDGMAALLRSLREQNPKLRLDRDVEQYAGLRP
jgi:hypothetical protein